MAAGVAGLALSEADPKDELRVLVGGCSQRGDASVTRVQGRGGFPHAAEEEAGGGISVTVKTLTGKAIALRGLDLASSLGDLKRLIEETEEIPYTQ